jgi:lipid A ethanolaminephosphotransferase
MGKYIANVLKSDAPEEFIILAANAATPRGGSERELIIVVVGETARADHFSLNGYRRETNPRLSRENYLVSFRQVSSCGTDTAISVPCLFAFDGRADFDVASARHTENVLDVLAKAGVNILWRDNNSDSKGVAERVRHENFRLPESNPVCDTECRDVGMLSGLQEYIDSQQGDILIVLHQMGSHGPAYFKRYPPEFEKYKPACHTLELSECTQEEIINAYDDTLLYTDYFLSRVIELLKANTPQFETAMFYISDHGESLGENGLYLHGMPYLFAPEAQTHVPVIAWIGPSSDIDYETTLTLKDIPNSHDAFSNSLLEAFEVEAEYYEKPEPVAHLFYMRHGDNAH